MKGINKEIRGNKSLKERKKSKWRDTLDGAEREKVITERELAGEGGSKGGRKEDGQARRDGQVRVERKEFEEEREGRMEEESQVKRKRLRKMKIRKETPIIRKKTV